MSSPLHKAPFGLLGTFDLKTQGKQPDRFGDLVQPVVEIRDHYVPLEIMERTCVVTNPATSFLDTFDVPNGELWIVRGWGAVGSLDAADVARQVLFFATINNGINQCPIGTGNSGTGPADGIRIGGHPTGVLPQPVFLRPGWGWLIGCSMSAAPTVDFTYSMSIQFQRLRD